MKNLQITAYMQHFIRQQVMPGDICIDATMGNGNYSGGDTGYQERDEMLAFIRQLDPHKYLVILSEYANRPNDPPIPVLIIKLQ